MLPIARTEGQRAGSLARTGRASASATGKLAAATRSMAPRRSPGELTRAERRRLDEGRTGEQQSTGAQVRRFEAPLGEHQAKRDQAPEADHEDVAPLEGKLDRRVVDRLRGSEDPSDAE